MNTTPKKETYVTVVDGTRVTVKNSTVQLTSEKVKAIINGKKSEQK